MKKQFGDDWSSNEEFKWYKDLVHNESHHKHESDDEEFFCECNEEETSNVSVNVFGIFDNKSTLF